MMAHNCNPSIQEAEAGGPTAIGQHGLHSEFKASLCNIASTKNTRQQQQ
jgi:hypothetical protein